MDAFRGLITLTLLLAFLALTIWLASGRNKHRFDAAARLPLEDLPLEDLPIDAKRDLLKGRPQ